MIYAPHVGEVSHVHGKLIDEIGYHCRDYFLEQWDRFEQYPGGILAHSTHVKGLGTFDAATGRETPRIRVTLATGISRERCDRDQSRLSRSRRRSNPIGVESGDGTLVVPRAGEMLYRVGRAPDAADHLTTARSSWRRQRMGKPLTIPANGALDFLALGALVHRLDPGVVPFHKAQTCTIHVSGGEYNTAANLSDCFRAKAGVATALVDYPIGTLIAERVQAMGVKPFYKHFAHDGARGPNMATVYSDRGYGVRAPGRVLQPRRTKPRRSSSPATSTGTRSSAPASAGSTAAGSSRRCRTPPAS